MTFDEDEYGNTEENPPDHLRRKWENEDAGITGEKLCPRCSQPVAEDAFFCLFCGDRIFEKSGLLGKLAVWIRGGKLLWFLLLLICAVSLLLVL